MILNSRDTANKSFFLPEPGGFSGAGLRLTHIASLSVTAYRDTLAACVRMMHIFKVT